MSFLLPVKRACERVSITDDVFRAGPDSTPHLLCLVLVGLAALF